MMASCTDATIGRREHGPSVPMPRAPQPIGACDTGGCRDAAGVRYNGAGNATLDANGRICHRNGAFMQCF